MGSFSLYTVNKQCVLKQVIGIGALGSFEVALFFNKDVRFKDEYIALLYFLPQNFDAIDLRPLKIFWDGLPCQPKAQAHSHHTAFIVFLENKDYTIGMQWCKFTLFKATSQDSISFF